MDLQQFCKFCMKCILKITNHKVFNFFKKILKILNKITIKICKEIARELQQKIQKLIPQSEDAAALQSR